MDEHAPIVYDLSQYREDTKDWGTDPSAYLLRYYTKYYFLATAGKESRQESSAPESTSSSTDATAPKPAPKIIDYETSLEVLRGDQYVYQSPNKLCVIGLAPTHPVIAQRDRYKVLNLRFDPKILSALPQPTSIPANSKKQPPPPCQPETVILKIEAKDLWAEAEAAKASENQGEDQSKSSETGAGAGSGSANNSSVAGAKSTSHENKKRSESIDPSRVIFVVRGAMAGHVMELNERLVRRKETIITDPVIIETMLDKASTHGYIAVIRPKSDKTASVTPRGLSTASEYEESLQSRSMDMS
ncbi:hypothetical protein BG011_001747 [Mortierella polycephala]|uniref:Uncharacterized protein n=1 Tax=Mortierella polycephala TaxID=41804 RepID=A0A9P6U5Z6_9FUNG|nr:hypothetical protein BG011_001747 [Mortierella polycephala]